MKPTQEQLEFGTTTLLIALTARNLETGDHCPRVNRLALQLGRSLRLSADELYDLKFGSLLHDIGKIRTRDAVLTKPGKLTETEWEEMRRHPLDGGSLLRALDFPESVCLIVEQHHEWFDGSGYPFGLAGDQIYLPARVFAVADTYDAITRDRCYRKGAAAAVALHEINSWSGTQFDPQVVERLIQLSRDNQLDDQLIPAAA
jgi:putative nucleotidyltransferase with HDIG domain